MRTVSLVIPLLALTGCAAMQSTLGIQAGFKKQPVTGLRAFLSRDGSICPGQVDNLIITAVLEDGTELPSQGAGDGKVAWKNFAIEGDRAWMSQRDEGVVVLSDDPMATLGAPARLTISSVHHPGISTALEIPAAYSCGFTADFSGANGRAGANGTMGGAGDHGVDKQSSESYAEPGGHGQRGGDGGHGADGESGQPGDDVEVVVERFDPPEGGDPLLKVSVVSLTSDRTQRFLLETDQGSLTVRSNGGSGGQGGNGGGGGSGGSGGTGAPAGNGGDGGTGGNGANGADGANGGQITIRMSAEAEAHLDQIQTENRGGSGGNAGTHGFGGSGGNCHSGADQGQGGEHGQQGSRAGRPGDDGPDPEVVIGAVDVGW